MLWRNPTSVTNKFYHTSPTPNPPPALPTPKPQPNMKQCVSLFQTTPAQKNKYFSWVFLTPSLSLSLSLQSFLCLLIFLNEMSVIWQLSNVNSDYDVHCTVQSSFNVWICIKRLITRRLLIVTKTFAQFKVNWNLANKFWPKFKCVWWYHLFMKRLPSCPATLVFESYIYFRQWILTNVEMPFYYTTL